MRSLLILIALGLAACAPAIPDSGPGLSNGAVDPGRGVGFENSLAQERARQAALAQVQQQSVVVVPPAPAGPSSALAPSRPVTQNAPVRVTPTAPARTTQRAAEPTRTAPPATAPSRDPELALIAARRDAQAAAANSGRAVVNASPSNAPPPIIDNPGGISNETDFAAVSSRRSIEGDAARRAQLSAQYQVVAPTALPSRTATGPNVVQYALRTSHPVGTRVHRRISVASAARTRARCAEYASANEAQAAFLARGGPQRDRLGLDPDGDGYACGWNPAPFRRTSGN